MATQKIGLTKLGLKKNTNCIPVEWNDQIIEVKEYLPIKDKMTLIEKIVNLSLDERNYANVVNISINEVLEMTFAYTTNINFTEKQKEDKIKLYDALKSNGLIDQVLMNMDEDEYSALCEYLNQQESDILNYQNTIAGIVDNIIENLPIQAEEMQKIVNNFDPSKFENVLNFAKSVNNGKIEEQFLARPK